MTPEHSKQLADLLTATREKQGLSASEVARRAAVTTTTVTRLEARQIPSPKAENLQSIAQALGLPASDVYAAAGWVPKAELPTLRPYLRTKYRQLPPEAAAEIHIYFEQIAERYGIDFDPTGGPMNGEDE